MPDDGMIGSILWKAAMNAPSNNAVDETFLETKNVIRNCLASINNSNKNKPRAMRPPSVNSLSDSLDVLEKASNWLGPTPNTTFAKPDLSLISFT